MHNDTQRNNTQHLGSLCCMLTQNMLLLLSVSITTLSIVTLSITIINAEIFLSTLSITTLNIYSRYAKCCVKGFLL